MKKYFCWGEDKEDLTPKVIAAKNAGGNVAYGFAKAETKVTKPRKWRVCVTCSQGHENIFEGEE
jgi:hypothetical protein